jgi:predicted PurR-regulated permease PerM
MAESRTSRLPRSFVTASEAAWRALVIAALVALVVFAAVTLRIVVLPFLVALIFSTVLEPPVRYLRARGLAPGLASALVFIGALTLVIGLFSLAATVFYEQTKQMDDAVKDGFIEVAELSKGTFFEISDDDLSSYIERIGGESGSGGLSDLLVSGVTRVAEFGAMLLLMLFFTFFLLKDGRDLFERATKVLPKRMHPEARAGGQDAWAALGRYMRGLAVIATFNALAQGIALVVIGVPAVLPLMLLTFLGSFIPLAGPIFAGVAGALVALANGSVTDASLVLGSAIVIQQFEGNVLEPVVLGRAVKLHPITVAAAVTSGAVLGGIPGAFLAVPLVAVLVAGTARIRSPEPSPSA